MAYDANGNFWIRHDNFKPGDTIKSSEVDENNADIVAGLNRAYLRDGTAPMSGQFLAISGKVGAPGIAFASDPDTGFWRMAAGVVVFVANKKEALRFDAQGDLITAVASGNFVSRGVADKWLQLSGGSAIGQGASLVLWGEKAPNNANDAEIRGGDLVVTDGNLTVIKGEIKGTFNGNGKNIRWLDADNIGSGTLAAARLPNIPAANLPNIPAGKIPPGSLPDIPGSKITGWLNNANFSGMDAANLSGQIPPERFDRATRASLGRAETAVQPTRQVRTGKGLKGGGALSANITLELDAIDPKQIKGTIPVDKLPPSVWRDGRMPPQKMLQDAFRGGDNPNQRKAYATEDADADEAYAVEPDRVAVLEARVDELEARIAKLEAKE